MMISSNNSHFQRQKISSQSPYNPYSVKKKIINMNISSKVFQSKKIEKKEKNEKKIEDFNKDNYYKEIKKIKNKGELNLNEHNRINVVNDTDSEISIQDTYYKTNKKKTTKLKNSTKLLVTKTQQTFLNVNKKNLVNFKNQKKLSDYIVKTEDRNKMYNSPNVSIHGNNNLIKTPNKYNITIPGTLSRSNKKELINKLNFNDESMNENYINEINDSSIFSQNLINMGTQKNKHKNSQLRNVEIIVSPDTKITRNIKSPDSNFTKSPITNNNVNNIYYMDNSNLNSIYNDYHQNKNNVLLQVTPLIDNNNNQFNYLNDKIINNDISFNKYNNEGSPISSYKYLTSPQRSPGGRVELKVNQFYNSNHDEKKKLILMYKNKLSQIILIQRFFREHLKYANQKIVKIQSLWRGYWLRKIIYIRLIMFYKGQALIEHLSTLFTKFIKRNFKSLIYKCSFKAKKQYNYKFLNDQMDVINRFKKLGLTIKKNYFENEFLKITKNSSFYYENHNYLKSKSILDIEKNEKKFEKLYYDLLKKYEELKNDTKKFNEKLMKIERSDILLEKNIDDTVFNQAFYLKESKIHKRSYDMNEESEIGDEILRQGEILLTDEKEDNKMLSISSIQIEKLNKSNRRMNEESKSKEDEEIIIKDSGSTISQRKIKKLSQDFDKDNEIKKNISFSSDIKNKKKQYKIEDDRHLNEKHFDNIQVDYSFEKINFTPLINPNYTYIEIQNNINFSVIDNNYYLEHLPIIEEENEELITVDNIINNFIIKGNRKDVILKQSDEIYCLEIIGKKMINKFIKLEKEEKVNQIDILKSKIKKEKIEYGFNNINVLINGDEKRRNKIFDFLIYDNKQSFDIKLIGKEKKEKIKVFNNLVFDNENQTINLISDNKNKKKIYEIQAENNFEIIDIKTEKNLQFTIIHFEIFKEGIKEEKTKLKDKIYDKKEINKNITLLNKKTILKKTNDGNDVINYAINNEIFLIEGYEKKEKETQTKIIQLNIQKNHFSLLKQEPLNLVFSLKKQEEFSIIGHKKQKTRKEKKKRKKSTNNLVDLKKINENFSLISINKMDIKLPLSIKKNEFSLISINKEKMKPIYNINKNEFSLIVNKNEKIISVFNIKKETFSLINRKEKIIPIFNINKNDFSLISIEKEKKKENKILIPSLNEIRISILRNKELEFNYLNEMVQTEENIDEKKNKTNIKEYENIIYQNNDFTFEIIPKEKETSDEKITTFLPKSKSRNSKILNYSEISFKQDTPLNSLDSNRSFNQFSESKTLLSEIISFSIIDIKKNTEKIIIEKPYNLKNKFDINLIKPYNNINIQLSYIKLQSSPFEKIKPLITSYEIKEKDLSNLSISNEKELTTSRDESKENTKDITQISKEIKNYDDLEIKRRTSKLKKSKENDFNELLPSFNNDISYNDDNENEKTISKDKSIDTINKVDNKQDNSYIGFQLDEPAQQLPLNNNNENIINNNYESYDIENKDEIINSPVFHNNNLENDILISKKFNDLILNDYIPDKNSEKSFEDFHIEKNINNNVITNYSLELISEKNDFYNENELKENINISKIKIDENEHKLIESIFTRNFFKKNKENEINNKKGKKNIFLKCILPIKVVQIMKQNYKKTVFYNLIHRIHLFIQNSVIKKIVINRLNKNKKINFEKWKNNYLIMKIKEKLIQNVKENNKINIIYQNGENFMIKGNEKEKKIESKNEVKNIEQIQKKSKIINQELEVQENINSITIISKREIKDKKNENKDEVKDENKIDMKKEKNKKIKKKKKKINTKQDKNEEKEIKEENKEETKEKQEIKEKEKGEKIDDKIIIRSRIIIKSKLNLIQKIKLRSTFFKWKENIESKSQIQNQIFLTYLPTYTRIFIQSLLVINHNFEYQINSNLNKNNHPLILNSKEKSKTFSNISQEFISDFYIRKSISQNFENKMIIEKKEKGIQSSPSLDVNVSNNNNFKNIIQSLPSLDEEVFIPNFNFNSYNVHKFETNEITNLQRNYSYNPKKNNLLISTHLQISYLPNISNYSISENKNESLNLNIRKSSNYNKNLYSGNNNYEEYDYNVPSNEQNDDFIIDSNDSDIFKKEKEINFNNENKNSEIIQIIEPLDEEIVENEKRKNIISQNIDDEIYVNVKINKKVNFDFIKKKIINFINRPNLKDTDTKKILKTNFKKWKNYTNPLSKSAISIRSIKISKKKKISSPIIIKNKLNLKHNNIEEETINVKEIIPRIRINEKIRLLVSIKHKAKILFNKWKKQIGISSEKKQNKSKLNLILLAKEINRKRCRSDNFAILYKQKSNLLYSNILKYNIKKYFNKIFNKHIKNIIPRMKKLIILYKKIPLLVDLIQTNLIKYSFRKIIKKSYEDNEKYDKMCNKVNNKKVLPTLENISALIIQNKYKQYLIKKNKKEKLFNLISKIDKLDEDNFFSLIYLCKWYYKIKLENEKKMNTFNNLKSLFNRLINKIIVHKLFSLTEKYADYISINILIDTLKNCFFRKIFNYIRLKFLLDKILSDDNEQFKKKYVRSKLMKQWNNKCKLLRRRKNSLMKMIKILQSHFVKSIINYSKFKKLKLILITISLVKKGNYNNK